MEAYFNVQLKLDRWGGGGWNIGLYSPDDASIERNISSFILIVYLLEAQPSVPSYTDQFKVWWCKMLILQIIMGFWVIWFTLLQSWFEDDDILEQETSLHGGVIVTAS
jgi:hypothetical protein